MRRENATFDLFKSYCLFQSKQRYDRTAIVRYLIRLAILFYRFQYQIVSRSSLITFSAAAFIENLIGIFLLFNEKKKTLKLSKYSKQRIALMRKQQLAKQQNQEEPRSSTGETASNLNFNKTQLSKFRPIGVQV